MPKAAQKVKCDVCEREVLPKSLKGHTKSKYHLSRTEKTPNSVSGNLRKPHDITDVFTTFLTTPPLTTGSWLVFMGASYWPTDVPVAAVYSFHADEGTAKATFAGQSSTGISVPGSPYTFAVSLVFMATVTSPGTLRFRVSSPAVGSYVVPGTETGYIAIKID